MNEKSKEVKKEEASGKGLATRGGWLSPFEDMDRFFEEAFTSRWPSLLGREWPDFPRLRWPAMPELRAPFEGRWPKVDVIDRDAEVVVRAELPGVKKEDLDVTTTDTTVTIKAVTEKEEKEDKGQYFRREMSRGEFQRTVALPQEVSSDQAKATFKDGVLELVLPKVKKTPRKSVKVE